MALFFDLDGTLIDSKLRLFNLFKYLVPNSELNFEEYWELKKQKKSHKNILTSLYDYSEKNLITFEQKWMPLIEDKAYLKLDEPFTGVTEYLQQLNKDNLSIYIVTARQNKDIALKQINSFGWGDLIKAVLVTEQKDNKENLIVPFLEIDKTNWIIGDTDSDIKVGKKLGISTVAVLTGFQGLEILKSSNPDFLLNSVLEFAPNSI